MKLSALIAELQKIYEECEDIQVEISCLVQPETIAKGQTYLISSPEFVVPESKDGEILVTLRDWPY